MADTAAEPMPEWARPDQSFPYFAIGIMGAGLGWGALNGLGMLVDLAGMGPFLGWVGLVLFALAFAFLLGGAVFLVRKRAGKPDRFGAETSLVLLGGGFVGSVLIGLSFAAMNLF